MADFSLTTFKYGNNWYDFVVAIGSQLNTQVNCVLETQYISEFNYTNSLNQLCISGTLTYLDKFGKITQFLVESYPVLVVYFGPQKTDLGMYDTYSNFNHAIKDLLPLNYKFIINKIEILSRNGDNFLYKFHLISFNWYKCIKNISYTTYGSLANQNKNNILELIKTGFSISGLKLNTENFNTYIQCNVSIDYITENNDNLFSYIKYIMNKLYAFDKKDQQHDTSIKYIYYNEYTDEYFIGDTVYVANKSKKLPQIMLSFMYSSVEKINYVKENKIYTSILSLPKTSVIKSLQTRIIDFYDYNKNQFISAEISTNELVDYCNGSTIFNGMQPKQSNLPNDINITFNNYQTQWNNTNNIYTEQFNHLTRDNALVIETDGWLNLIPGQYINIIVNKESELHESLSTNDDIENRFLELDGLWCISSITNKISPSSKYYRQQISLFRSFIVSANTMQSPNTVISPGVLNINGSIYSSNNII